MAHRDGSETPANATLRRMPQPYASVLVVGPDQTLAQELRKLVDAKTGVIPVTEAPVLLRNLKMLRTQRRMIVLDPLERTLTAAIVAEPTLLEGALLVLWHPSSEDEARVRAALPKVSCARIGSHGGVRELAAFVHLGQ